MALIPGELIEKRDKEGQQELESLSCLVQKPPVLAGFMRDSPDLLQL